MDGTLLNPEGRVSARTTAAVAAARAVGIHVVPVTGRPPQALWDLAAAAGLGPLGVCSNGAALVDLDRLEIVEVELIAGEVAANFVDLLRSAVPGILLASDELDCFSYEKDFFEVPVDWQEVLEEVTDIREIVQYGCIKLLARVDGMPPLDLIDILVERVAELAHVTSSGAWVEIGAPQISKAYALERLCARLGVRVADVVAIGDNHNDLSVLAWAGRAMAPANAIPEVLAVAEQVLASNAEDGVAQFLEELVAERVA